MSAVRSDGGQLDEMGRSILISVVKRELRNLLTRTSRSVSGHHYTEGEIIKYDTFLVVNKL